MQHLSCNIPSSIFYGTFYLELLRIARCTLMFCNLTLKPSEIYNEMVLQGGNTKQLQNYAEKMLQKYPTVLLKYNITLTELWNSILTNKNTFLKLLILHYYYYLYQTIYSFNDAKWTFYLTCKCNIFCTCNSLHEYTYI